VAIWITASARLNCMLQSVIFTSIPYWKTIGSVDEKHFAASWKR
jgi:hypothetical protein